MKNKSQVFVWYLFDFANSFYATIIVAFVFAVYFTDVICSKEPIGDFYWSLGITISMIISAVLNPVCGAIADYTSNKKKFLFYFTMLAVISTALMYFTGEGKILFALVLFIASNIGFQTGLTFYDAFISDIVEERFYNKVSATGYAVGYAGSLLSVIMVFPLKDNPEILFILTAAAFLIFSLPLFLFLKEKRINTDYKKINFIGYGFKKVFNTIKNINKYKNLRNYLLAFFLYIDAVNTIIFFSGIYAKKTLGFSTIDLAIFFLIVQITAMAGSFIFGYLGDRLGILRSIMITLIVWTAIIFWIFFFIDKESYFSVPFVYLKVHSFFIIGGLAGLFLGSTQSLSRTLMTKLTPFEIKTEFFGFYALFDKTSTLLGPLTFGLVSWLTGSQKFAVLSIGLFFLLGMLLLRRVKENN